MTPAPSLLSRRRLSLVPRLALAASVLTAVAGCGDGKEGDEGSDAATVDHSGIWKAAMTSWDSSINAASIATFQFVVTGQDIQPLTFSLELHSGSLSCETACEDENTSCALPDAVTFSGDGFRAAERADVSYTIYGTFTGESSVEGTANWFVRFCGSFDGRWSGARLDE